MNELIESSRENTSECFCGAAFVTFNTIKEQEDYLSQIQKNCYYYLTYVFLNSAQNFYYYLGPYYISCLGCFLCLSYPFYYCCSCDKKSLDIFERKMRFDRAPEPEDIFLKI